MTNRLIDDAIKDEWSRLHNMIMLCGEEECGETDDATVRLRNLIDGLIDRKREIARLSITQRPTGFFRSEGQPHD